MQHSFDRRFFLSGLAGLAISFTGRRIPTARASGATPFPPFGSPVALPTAAPRSDGPLRVVASTTILADLAHQIGGDRAEVRSLLPANVDPHDYEPSPSDVIAIEEADLVILHGLHLDTWVDPLVEASMTKAPVIVATAGIPTLGTDDKQFGEGDPHVWFDPTRVETMVTTIEAALANVDSDGASAYQARRDAYVAELAALDTEIAARIELIPAERRVLVTNHDALAYYADRYGLTIVGTVIPGLDSRTEPSAKEIAKLIEQIQESGVQVVFAENTVSPVLADALASDAGIRVAPELYTDSLGEPGSGADTYIGLMQTDTKTIVENLRA